MERDTDRPARTQSPRLRQDFAGDRKINYAGAFFF